MTDLSGKQSLYALVIKHCCYNIHKWKKKLILPIGQYVSELINSLVSVGILNINCSFFDCSEHNSRGHMPPVFKYARNMGRCNQCQTLYLLPVYYFITFKCISGKLLSVMYAISMFIVVVFGKYWYIIFKNVMSQYSHKNIFKNVMICHKKNH